MPVTLESAAPQPTLASVPLPKRVRRVLEQVYTLSADEMARALERMLSEFEQHLFRQADQAASPGLQQSFFDTLRLVRQNRADLIPEYLSGLEAALAGLRTPPPVSDNPAARLHFGQLRLLEDNELDEGSVLRAIAARHEARSSLALHLLGQRFGVLACAPAFDAARLPVGPHRLGRILAQASRGLQLDLQPRLELFRCFDQYALNGYTHLVETLNALLAREHILPNLAYVPVRVRPALQSERSGEAVIKRRAQLGGGRVPEMAVRAYTGWFGSGQDETEDGPAGSGPDPAEEGDFLPKPALRDHDADPYGSNARHALDAGAAPVRTGRAHPPRRGGAAPSGSPGVDFGALQQMLAARRGLLDKLSPGSKPAPDERTQLSPQEIQQVLARMQDAAAKPATDGHARTPRTVHDVRQALLAQTRQLRGQAAALSRDDNDAFELLAILLAEVQRELRQDAPGNGLLHKLVVPLLRLVVQDRGFFVQHHHPARQLLNAVAESSATWLSDEEHDPQLNDQLHTAVEEVVTRFNGDPQVFEAANSRVQQHLKVMARRAEVAERRHVDAARGREKLELAKLRAGEIIATAAQGHKLPRFVHTLLANSWTDVLTLTLLRNEETSPEWQRQLAATQAIVRATSLNQPASPPPELAAQIEQSLTLVGYHPDEAAAIARRLTANVDDDAADSASRTELAMQLKARGRLGQETAPEKPSILPRNAEEQAAHDVLRTLPFGTWFEFVINQQGDVVRRRLSWYSPLTDHALFVNQRGQRVGEQSLDSLARAMAQDQVRIVTIDHGSIVDRAWHNALNMLRGFIGGKASGEARE